MANSEWDVIIIGTGAGGGTLALRLAETGKRILLLERGELLPREAENWSEHEVVTRGRYRAKEEWLDAQDRPFTPFTHYCVGGNTKLYGAALLRLRAHDFEATRTFDGISPAWPLSYAEFEPYYARAEQLYGVHGEAGRDPHEPPRSGPYPHAALAHEPRIAALAARLEQIGLRPFPLPLGLRSTTEASGEAPIALGLFDGYPDPNETKADAHVVGVKPALRSPNVALRTGALVERLETSASGREVTGVHVRSAHGVEPLRAHLVVLACGAIQSAALLLRSHGPAHPRGLCNAHDLVGRHYMTHNNGALIMHSRHPNDARFQKTFALMDFYRRAPDSDLPLGSVQLMGKSDRATLRALFAELIPDGDGDALSRHTVDFWLTAEDLPRYQSRVTLAPSGQIKLHYTPSNREALRRLRAALMTALARAEPDSAQRFAHYELGIDGVSHQVGTLRFGDDPTASVLDRFCRAHALDNLYVCDGSFFCSSGAVNPSLTIIANALRVGDHLAARLR
jgi:choline dehydrogenase-like flavoprotein